MAFVVNLVVAAVMLVPFVLLGAVGWLIYQRQTGEKVEATVVACDLDIGYKRAAEYCTATWTVEGQEFTGPLNNAGNLDAGEKVEATLRDGELYGGSLVLPLILIGLGLPMLLLPYSWVRRRLRGDRRTPAPQ